MEKAVKWLERDEGWRGKPYKDSLGHWTVGYGFNMEILTMPKEVGKLWLKILISQCYEELSNTYSWFDGLSENRKTVIVDMYYNLGSEKFAGFELMVEALAKHDFKEAKKQALDSRWATQVGERADRIANVIEKG